MLIGLIADSHENMPFIRKAVNMFNQAKVDLVLHAGDLISPITAKEFEKLKAKFVAVFGNNDGEKFLWKKRVKGWGEIYEDKYETVLEGRRILLVHDPKNLEDTAKSGKYDIIIYGHTHKADEHVIGNTKVINPGECGGWLTGISTVGFLELPSATLKIENLGKVEV
jgi:uncharacterized protein